MLFRSNIRTKKEKASDAARGLVRSIPLIGSKLVKKRAIVSEKSTPGVGAGVSYLNVAVASGTTAVIESGAEVRGGNISVEADTDAMVFALGLAGGKSKGVGVSGALVYVDITNTTLASIGSGAAIRASGDVHVTADDETETYGGAGGITTGGSVGFGVTGWVATVSRNTQAFIGEQELQIGGGEGTLEEGVGGEDNTIELGYVHGFSTGDRVAYTNHGDEADIGGLVDGNEYFVRVVSPTSVQLVTTSDAVSNGSPALALAPVASWGQLHSIGRVFSPNAAVAGTAESIDLGVPHGFHVGQAVVYRDQEGVAVGGLVDGSTYYAIPDLLNPNVFQLAATEEEARQKVPVVVDLSKNGASGSMHGFGVPFTAADSTGQTSKTIDLGYGHGRSGGDLVVYNSGDGDPVEGLVSGNTYVVAVAGETTVHLMEPAAVAPLEVDLLDSSWGLGSRSLDASEGRELVLAADTVAFSPLQNTFTFTQPHGLVNDEVVKYRFVSEAGSADESGLNHNTDYYVLVVDSLTIQLFSSPLPLLAVDGGSATGDSHTLFIPFDAVTAVSDVAVDRVDVIDLGYVHGFALGDRVSYSHGGGASVDGLLNKSTYFVIPVDATSIRLAASLADAVGNNWLDVDPSTASGAAHTIGRPFQSYQTINQDDASIRFQVAHGLSDGDAVVYGNGDGISIGGLVDGDTYYVTKLSDYAIQLSSSSDNLPGTRVTLDGGTASGNRHVLTTSSDPAYAGSVISDGNLVVTATNTGRLVSATLASSQTETEKDEKKIGDDPAEKKTEDAKKKKSKETKAGSKYGLAVSGSVTTAVVDDTTRAFLQQATIQKSGNTTVTATNDTKIITVAGAVAISMNKSGSKAVGLAGSVALNQITLTTDSFIRDSDLQDVKHVIVKAESSGRITAVAAGIGVAANGAGVAGSVAYNTIDSNTLAYVDDSTVIVDSIRIEATDTSSIIAVGGSIAYGGKAGIGAGIAWNRISGGAVARLARADVEATGALIVSATDDSQITSVAAAIAVAFNQVEKEEPPEKSDKSNNSGDGGGEESEEEKNESAGSLALAAGISINTIDTTTEAVIVHSGTSSKPLTAAKVELKATAENSRITGVGGGIAVGVSWMKKPDSKGSASSLAAGASYVFNEINQNVYAKATETFWESVGPVIVHATSATDIHSLAIAGAVAVATGSKTSNKAFAGAGAVTVSTIRGEVSSRVADSTIATTAAGGVVEVVANDKRVITADAGGVAIAITYGSDSKASNTSVAIGAAIAFNTLEDCVVAATVTDSTINGADAVTVTATSELDVDALSLAGALAAAVSGGKGGTALAGAGAYSRNIIDLTLESSSRRTEHTGKSLLVSSVNTATIDAETYGVSIAVATASDKGAGFSLSVGVSLAKNEIDVSQSSFTEDCVVTTTDGGIAIRAENKSFIDAVSVAASIAAAYSESDGPAALSGGGAEAKNRIGGTTNAYAARSTLNSASDVTITATNKLSEINASVVAASISAALSDKDAAAISIGAGRTLNVIENEDGSPIEVRAYLKESPVEAGGALTVEATTASEIDSYVLAASVAFAEGKNALGMSGAGTETFNRISTKVEASISGDAAGLNQNTSAQGIRVVAVDASVIEAGAGVASIAIALGSEDGDNALSLSVGVTLSENTIENDVVAVVKNAGHIDAQGGDITVASRSLGRGEVGSDFDTLEGPISLAVGDTVRVANDYSGGGVGGRVYAYRGFVPDYTADTVDFDSTETAVNVFQGDTVKTGGVIYQYVGDDDNGFGVELDLTPAVQNYSGSANWEPATLVLQEGNTLEKDGVFYRFKGPQAEVDVSGALDASSEGQWEIIADPDRIDLSQADYSNTKRWELADASITARAAAVSVGVARSKSGNGFAVSGAGAVARNTILSRNNAYFDDSTVTASGSVVLEAVSSAVIDASVVTASVAVGLGGKAALGVSIGVALAENLIGWDGEGNRSPAEVQAFSRDTSINAGGSLQVTATSTSLIDAIVFAGSVGIASAGKSSGGVALSGAGVSAVNKIATNIQSFLDGDGLGGGFQSGVRADSLTVAAYDYSRVNALAGAVTIAAQFGGKSSTAVSVGVSLSQNHIGNNVAASIHRTSMVETTSGDLVVDAATKSVIDSIVFAASAALSGGKGTSIAVSGAGASSRNIILSKTKSLIDDGGEALPAVHTIKSAGGVTVHAASDSTIVSEVVAFSAALAGGNGQAGVGASLGYSVARNFIGWDPYSLDIVPDKTTADEVQTVSEGTTVSVEEGVRVGDTYRYIGETKTLFDYQASDGIQTLQNDRTKKTRVSVDGAIYVWEGEDGVDVDLGQPLNSEWRVERLSSLLGEDFGDPLQWQLVLPIDTEDAVTVEASIKNSSVEAAGAVSVQATTAGSVESSTVAGSVALTIGKGLQVGLSGTGVVVENRVRSNVTALIDGDERDGATTTITAASIAVKATDSSRITSDAVGATIAGAASNQLAFSLSIGITSAYNEVANAVRAAVKDIEKLNATGDLIIRAETLGGDQAAADYTTEAGETELSVGSTVLLADDYQGGGKAGRTYRYRGLTADYTSSYGLGENDATAYQVELVKKEEGDSFDRGTTVLVSEGYDSLKGSAGTLYEWVGADGTVAGSATGRLTEQNYLDTALWRAVTPDTRTLSTEDYSNSRLWELCDGSIIATAISASLSGAFGSKFGGAASGAGAIATNVILSSTKATLENSDVESVNDVSVTAKDTSSIIASVSAWSVASGVGGDAAMAGSLGVSIARNFIGYDQARASVPGVGVFANIQNSSITASGNVQVLATAQNLIDSFVLAGSVAATYSGGASLSASGSGVYSVNRIGNHVSAVITGSQDDITASSVSVSAVDESKISSIADAVSVAIAVGGFGGAFSLGISLAQNSVATETTASVSAVQIATTGPVAVTARDNTAISAFAVSVSVSGATTLAISGGGTDASNIINTKTNAIIENAAIGSDTQKVNSVTVSAQSTSLVDSEVGAVSASLSAGVAVGIGVALARNFIGWDPKGITTLADYSSTDRPATLRRGKRVRVMSGPHEGDVYEFIGDDVTDGDLTLDGPQPINLDQQTWYDTSLWELVNIAERPAEIQAQIIETSVHATDAITVEATGQQKIDSLVYAGAIGVGGSFGASGAGVNAENRVNTIVTAAIDGDGTAADADGISAGTVVLVATDSSGIKSVAAAASIAGGGGGAVSVGVSLAENIVSNLVDAHIKNCDEGVVTTNGIISIRARATGDSLGSIALSESFTIAQLDDASKEETDAENQEADRAGDAAILSSLRGLLLEQGIPLAEDTDSDSLRIVAVEEGVKWNLVAPDGEVLSLTLSLDGASIAVNRSTITAVSAAASIAGGSMAVSGAGANARNTITSDALAYVDSSLLGTETQNIGDVQINASSDSVIHALVLAASLSGGTQALSIGAARSRNTIGSDSEIRALLKNTSVKSSGTVSLNAIGRQEIDAVVVAGSVAVAGSTAMSVTASGAGAKAVNDIGNTIDASISGDNETAVHAQQVELDAKDVSTITSWVGAASLAASFAGGANSLSIGVGLARNTITTTVTSGISDAAEINTQAKFSTNEGGVSSLKTGDRVLVETGYLDTVALSTDWQSAIGKADRVELDRFYAATDLNTEIVESERIYYGSLVEVKDGYSVAGQEVEAGFYRFRENNLELPPYLLDDDGNVIYDFKRDENGDVILDQNGQPEIDGNAPVFDFSIELARDATGSLIEDSNGNYLRDVGEEVTLNAEDYGDSSRWSRLGGEPGAVYAFLGIDSEEVHFPFEDYSNEARWRRVGANWELGEGTGEWQQSLSSENEQYKYVGEAAELDLQFQDFAADPLWVPVTLGGIQIAANETASINATAMAASVAVSAGAFTGLSLSGAGADARNVILTTVRATIKNSSVKSVGDIAVLAENESTIDAAVGSLAAAAAVGGKGAVSLAVGSSIARNHIGYLADGTAQKAEVTATIIDSNVTGAGTLELMAQTNQHVTANVDSIAAAAAAGGTSSAASGAGVDVANKISTTVEASIVSTQPVVGVITPDSPITFGTHVTVDGNISLQASDTSTITSDGDASAVAASFGVSGGALAVGVALGKNHVENTISAFVENSEVISKGGGLSLEASEESSLFSSSQTAAVSVSNGIRSEEHTSELQSRL